MTLFNKKLTTLALAAVLTLGLAGAAQAAGRDYRPDAQAYQNFPGLSTEQQAAAKKIHDESVAGTSEIREKLRAKRAELDAQLASPQPDKDKIESLSREIGELRGKLMAARVDMRAKLAKEGIPAEAFAAGPGNGGPRDGFGPGKGGPRNGGPRANGPQGDAQGYGPCWGPDGHGYGYGYHHGRRGGHQRGGWGNSWNGNGPRAGYGCGCW